jgi:hypothetical protein
VKLWRSRTAALLEAAAQLQAETAAEFAVDVDSIDPAVFGLASYSTSTAPAARIDRRSAIQVPAVKRVRDLIAGTLGALPHDLIDAGRRTIESPLLGQPERNVPRSVTMTRLYEDLLFETIAWWQIATFDWRNYPAKVKRLDPRKVRVDDNARPGSCGDLDCSAAVFHQSNHVHDRDLIRFDSPTDGLLSAGARAIRTCLMLDQAAANAADGVPPMDYFTPAEGADPLEDDTDVETILDNWTTARRARRTAYVPAALKYNANNAFSPEQLQLADQRQHAVLEIARVGGVDAEEVHVAVTSRTYFNADDRRKSFTDFTLGMYRQAVEDRLSMGDVSPRGQYVKVNLSAFLRSDDLTRMGVYEAGLRVGVYAEGEPRELEDRPPLEGPAAPVRALPNPTTREATG